MHVKDVNTNLEDYVTPSKGTKSLEETEIFNKFPQPRGKGTKMAKLYFSKGKEIIGKAQ